MWVHSFIQIRNASQNVCTPNHRKAPWSHPKVYRHLINNIKSERDVGKTEKICLGELNPCPRISTFGLVHSNTCLWSKETLFMRAKCINEEHAVAPAPYLIWDSCYCSRKLSPMEDRFSKWFKSVKKVFTTFSYLYLWHTMWFHAEKLLKTLKFENC